MSAPSIPTPGRDLGPSIRTPRRHLGPGIHTPGRALGPGIPLEGNGTRDPQPPVNRHTSENITFAQLGWQAVMNGIIKRKSY